MLEKKELPSETRRLLKLARTKYNFLPTDEEIIWLNDLGRLVENPPEAYPNTEGFCLSIGGHIFKPRSVMSSQWFSSYAKCLHNSPLETIGLAFSCDENTDLRRLTDPIEIMKAVQTFADNCTLSLKEFEQVIDWILNIDPLDVPREKLREPETTSIASYIGFIIKQYGGDFDSWLNAPEQRVLALIDEATLAEGQTPKKHQCARAMNAILFAFGVMLKTRDIEI